MKNFPDWQAHEREVAELLGIDLTVSSGNKFYDISDATTRSHVLDDKVQFLADMKSTIRKSFRIYEAFLKEYRERAILRGKIFLMPVRFEHPETKETSDWVVVHANDFSELLGLDVKADSLERKAMLETRERKILAQLKSIAETMSDLVEDKSSPNSTRKTSLKALDIIDELYFDLLNKDAR